MATYSDQRDHFTNFVLKRKQLTGNSVNSQNFQAWFTSPSNKFQFWLWIAPETRDGDFFSHDFGIQIRLNEFPFLNNAIAGGESRVRQSREFTLVDEPFGSNIGVVQGFRYDGTWLQAMNTLGTATTHTLTSFSITNDSDENEDYMTASQQFTSTFLQGTSYSVQNIGGLIAPDTQVLFDIPSVGPADGNYEWYINLIYLECDYVGYDPSYPLAT